MDTATQQKTVTEEKNAADVVKTDIIEFLKGVRKGGLLYECSIELEKLVAAIRKHKKGGQLNITVKVDTLNKGSAHTLSVVGECTAKLPKSPPPASVFFSTNNNTLQKHDPRQGTFEGMEE